MSEPSNYFSPDYNTARKRFKNAAHDAGAKQYSLPIPGQTPTGEPLSIDIAWLGSATPKHVLLHSSGLHGVEGFSGTAIQLHTLTHLPKIPAEHALILVHTLNPYGMAWLRRANGENVDLNRNYLSDSTWEGASDAYRVLAPFLNPESPPRLDFFYLRIIAKILRYGFQALKQALACGQYEFERGLFFGGKTLQAEIAQYRTWLTEHITPVQRLMVMDVHTGLGKAQAETLFMHANPNAHEKLEHALGQHITLAPTSDAGYSVRGGMWSLYAEQFPQVDYITQECGTVSPLQILNALRNENRWHYYGDGNLHHPAKLGLKHAFCPDDKNWREQALKMGVERLHQAAHYVFNDLADS